MYEKQDQKTDIIMQVCYYLLYLLIVIKILNIAL
jgi:hypothetical protein